MTQPLAVNERGARGNGWASYPGHRNLAAGGPPAGLALTGLRLPGSAPRRARGRVVTAGSDVPGRNALGPAD